MNFTLFKNYFYDFFNHDKTLVNHTKLLKDICINKFIIINTYVVRIYTTKINSQSQMRSIRDQIKV